MPPRTEGQSVGCLATSVVYLALWGLLAWVTGPSWVWLGAVFAVAAVAAIIIEISTRVNGGRLLRECRRVYEPRGVRFLVVYSESPTWKEYIRDSWLPRFGDQAVLLNWTERARWRKSSLEVRLFKHFIHKRFIHSPSNFNPAVLVIRDHESPLIFRFYYAFQQAKNGRREYLERLEAELFTHVQPSNR